MKSNLKWQKFIEVVLLFRVNVSNKYIVIVSGAIKKKRCNLKQCHSWIQFLHFIWNFLKETRWLKIEILALTELTILHTFINGEVIQHPLRSSGISTSPATLIIRWMAYSSGRGGSCGISPSFNYFHRKNFCREQQKRGLVIFGRMSIGCLQRYPYSIKQDALLIWP